MSIRAFEGDARRIGGLEALGYTAGALEGVWFRADLTKPLADLPLPEGFRERDSAGVDPGASAKAHSDAWNDLSEIGLPEARSQFPEDHYLSLMTTPNYDSTLGLLLEAEDGNLP